MFICHILAQFVQEMELTQVLYNVDNSLVWETGIQEVYPTSAKPYTCQYDEVSSSQSQKPVVLKAGNLIQKLETINQKIPFLTN